MNNTSKAYDNEYQSICKGHDAECYIRQDRGDREIISFHKEYSNKDIDGRPIKKEDIRLYHAIHRMLSKKERIIDNYTFTIGKNKYKGIKFKVLDLDPDDVHEGPSVDKNKKQVFITHPTYVPGKLLADIEDRYWDSFLEMEFHRGVDIKENIYNLLREDIIAYTEQTFGLEVGFILIHLHEGNIKIEDAPSDGYFHLLITDLGTQMAFLLKRNSHCVKKIQKEIFDLLDKGGY